MPVLADTSVWVDYFRSGDRSGKLDFFIDENLIAVNDLILAELLPFLKVRRQKRLITLLYAVEKLPLKIDWNQIIEFQTQCLKNGLNGIGIPDLIIAQNALQNDAAVFSLDAHFKRIRPLLKIWLVD
ncbi:PIN domain-containing protein [bacterium]|nr:PIN domain-containing protein [bacterium]